MKTLGYFGSYGGVFVPETLMPALEELETAFTDFCHDTTAQAKLASLLRDWAGRPTPLYHAKGLSDAYGAQIYLKREDLLHGGAHKTNNALGQGLLADFMGKPRLIAETGAGQHGVATAMAGALLHKETHVYMGSTDIARQQPNVFRMQLLGTNVISVESGSKTLKDAINDALRDWITNVHSTHYVIGTVTGPHPFPTMVKHFHEVIGREAKQQMMETTGRLPDAVVACVGGGSNAMGIFSGFLADTDVALYGVEPGGEGIASGRHGAVFQAGRPGVLHGTHSMLMQDEDGQILETHSVSAGLDYPGVGPEHAYLHETGRAQYPYATDVEAMAAFQDLAKYEGILPALESCHALAYAKKLSAEGPTSRIILVNLSGRGDKDLATVLQWLG